MWGLRFAWSAINVLKWCSQRIEALAQPPIEPLLRLLAEIADVFGGDDGLDFGGQTADTRVDPQIVMREPHIDAGLDEIPDIGSGPQIARIPIDLAQNHALSFLSAESSHIWCRRPSEN